MSKYLFGYGSLICRKSAENALKRQLTENEFVAAMLKDYRRLWRAKERVFSDELGREITAIFLDIEFNPGCYVNGVLFPVTENELSQLKKREKNYRCVEVTEDIITPRVHGKVYTFVAKQEYRLADCDKSAYIPRMYQKMILDGGAEFGEGFIADYHSTTDKTNLPVFDGGYQFVDFEQSQYV